MAAQALTDVEFASLTAALGLRPPATPAEWEAQLHTRVGQVTRAAFFSLQAARREQATQGSTATLATDREFYRLVGSDVELFRAMLEGRLVYYEAVLPRIAEVVSRGSHRRIADLGSYGGLA